MYNFSKRLEGLSGDTINTILKAASDPNIISFSGGNPAPASFPDKALADIAYKLISEYGKTVLQYGNSNGYPSMLNIVEKSMNDINIRCSRQNILITSGSTQGIELSIKAFINPGDVVLTESPTFIGTLNALRQYEAHPVGFTLSNLENQILRYHPKMVYIIPSYQNPTGACLNIEERRKIYDICAKYNVIILEDDPYRELYFTDSPMPPIKTFDKENKHVIFLFSASKIVSPGIRVGAVVAHSEIIEKLITCKQSEDVHTSNLSQAMVAEYMLSSDFRVHLKTVRNIYKQQSYFMSDELRNQLPEFEFSQPSGGMFLWCRLPENVDTSSLLTDALGQGVSFVPGTVFYPDGGHSNTMRMSYSMCTPEEISSGISKLRTAYNIYCQK